MQVFFACVNKFLRFRTAILGKPYVSVQETVFSASATALRCFSFLHFCCFSVRCGAAVRLVLRQLSFNQVGEFYKLCHGELFGAASHQRMLVKRAVCGDGGEERL